MYFGFRTTMMVAVGAYLLAWFVYRGLYSGYISDKSNQI